MVNRPRASAACGAARVDSRRAPRSGEGGAPDAAAGRPPAGDSQGEGRRAADRDQPGDDEVRLRVLPEDDRVKDWQAVGKGAYRYNAQKMEAK